MAATAVVAAAAATAAVATAGNAASRTSHYDEKTGRPMWLARPRFSLDRSLQVADHVSSTDRYAIDRVTRH